MRHGAGTRRLGVWSVASVVVAVAAGVPADAQVAAPWLELTGPESGWLEVPHSAALNPTSAITVEAWVYLNSREVFGISGCCAGIVGKGFVDGYSLTFASAGGYLRFYARGSASSVLSTGSVSVGEWTHVAVAYDGVTTRFYVDGADAGVSTAMSGPVLASLNPLTIGHDTGFDASPDGMIDEVRLWNVARSRSDILATMRTPLDGPRTGLVGVWHLDGNGLDTAGGRHGVLVGDARFAGGAASCTHEYFVAAGGHLPGVPPTQWVSDLDLLNHGSSDAAVTVELLPRGGDNSAPRSFTTSVAAGRSAAIPDVVLARFGEANLAAALRICSDVELLVASRIYNQAASGTFGQGVPGETATAAVTPGGGPRHLTGLHENDAYRCNVGFTNTAAVEASVTVELHAAGGTLLGVRTYTLPPYGHLQRSRIFTEVTAAPVTGGWLRATASGGGVLVYASVVDAATGDPTFLLAR